MLAIKVQALIINKNAKFINVLYKLAFYWHLLNFTLLIDGVKHVGWCNDDVRELCVHIRIDVL